MKSVNGWRAHYDSYPYVALGVALGGGLLLGGLLAGPSTRSSNAPQWRVPLRSRSVLERHQVFRNWVNIAVATYKVAETLYRVAPLLRDQFAGVERSRSAGLLG